jgi:hypothetical protein
VVPDQVPVFHHARFGQHFEFVEVEHILDVLEGYGPLRLPCLMRFTFLFLKGV